MIENTLLYHGTLKRNVPLIDVEGILPKIGDFTKNVYGKECAGVVPAVFMADIEGLERVVHAMVASIFQEITDEDYDEYEIGNDYHLNDDLFFKYGAIFEIQKSKSFSCAGKPKPKITEPLQAESGDWYSIEPVQPHRTIVGNDLRDFLFEQGLVPSEINDFVDPDSILNTQRHNTSLLPKL